MLDFNADGTIELQGESRMWGQEEGVQQLDDIFHALDLDRSGSVCFEEWRSHWATRVCNNGLKDVEAALMSANKWLRRVSEKLVKNLSEPAYGNAVVGAL